MLSVMYTLILLQYMFIFLPGILVGMRPCGITLFISELFILKSLSQVYGVLHEFLARQKNVAASLSKEFTVST